MRAFRGALNRFLSVVLSLTFLFSVVFSSVPPAQAETATATGSSVVAAAVESDAAAQTASAAEPDVPVPDVVDAISSVAGHTDSSLRVVGELTDKRTTHTRQYLLSNGSIRAQVSLDALNYLDAKTGSFQPVDVTLAKKTVSGRGVWTNTANSFELQLPDRLSDGVSMEASGTKVLLRPSSGKGSASAPVSKTSPAARSLTATEVVYAQAFEGASLDYESIGSGLKETITLASPSAYNTWGFDLTVTNGNARLEEDGSISIVGKGQASPLMTLPKAWMQDSSATGARSEAVSYVLSGSAPSYHIDVVADTAWLIAPERVYPVMIDPSVCLYNGATGGIFDTMVSKSNPNSKYRSMDQLYVGDAGSGNICRSLINFAATWYVPQGCRVNSSTVQVYLYGNNSTGPNCVNLSRVNNYWDWEATWNTTMLGQLSWTYYNYVQIQAGSGRYIYIDSTALAQCWFSGYPDYGVILTSNNESGGSGYLKKFYSSEHSTYGPRPTLWVDYTPQPSVTLTTPSSGAGLAVPQASWSFSDNGGGLPQAEYQLELATSAGGPAVASCDVNSAANQATIPAPPEGWQENQTYYVRVAAADQPPAGGRLWSNWSAWTAFTWTPAKPSVTVTNPPSSGAAFLSPTVDWSYSEASGKPQLAYEAQIALTPGGPAVSQGSGDGGVTHATLDPPEGGWQQGQSYYVRVRAQDRPLDSGALVWSDWSNAAPFTYLPLPGGMSAVSKVTTASPDWFFESDSNGDGLNDSRDDTNGSGRGSVTLSWSAASSAEGYRIYLSDGNAYRLVGSTVSTSWASSAAGLYPSDTAIAALAGGTAANPFCAGSGLDLRDDPRALYAKTAGTQFDGSSAYHFKVVPYNASGETSLSAAPDIPVSLDNRTIHLTDDSRHAVYDLGDIFRHSGGLYLERGSLELDVTDLAIASFGPEASLSRHYSSAITSSTAFAPGWRFSFEQSLAVAGSAAVYTDESGDPHRFSLISGSWTAPSGYQATLAQSGSDYEITLKDRSVLTFDGTSGLIKSVTDSNGNTVSYTRPTGHVIITAANGQQIDVTLSGTSVTGATYATAAGTRQIVYSGSGASYTASYYPGTSDAYRAVYTYGSGRLSAITSPDFEDTSTAEGVKWTFGYDGSNRLSSWHLVNTSQSFGENSVSYSGTSATVTTPCGAGLTATSTWTWNPSGTLASKTPKSGTGSGSWAWGYSATNECVYESTPTGHRVFRAVDAHGNVLSETDETGNTTHSTYDPSDRLLTVTDPGGSVTTYTYSGTSTDLDTETKTLGGGAVASTGYTYDAQNHHLLITKTESISATSTVVTHYSQFAANGEPQTITVDDVALMKGGSGQQVITTKSYDAFGSLIWEKNALGQWVSRDNAYTISGHLFSSKDPSGAVTTSYTYDRLGNVKATLTGDGNGTVINHVSQVSDPFGTALSKTSWDGDVGRPALAIERSTTDSAGRIVHTDSCDGNGVALSSTKNTYDAEGRITAAWAASAPGSNFPVSDSTRTSYDAEGHVISATDPGASTSTTTEYYPSGLTHVAHNADGTVLTYTYDACGRQLTEKKTSNGIDSTTSNTYDLGGRTIKTTDEAGTETEFAYDLLGRQLSSGLEGEAATQNSYNKAGWILSSADADSIETTTTYDAVGRVTRSSVGGKATLTAYDTCGRTTSVTDPEGNTVAYGYDAFSRATDETQTDAASNVLKATHTAYDATSRAIRVTKTQGSSTVTQGYQFSGNQTVAIILSYGGVDTASVIDPGTQTETSRQVTVGDVSFTRNATAYDASKRELSASLSGMTFSVSRVFDSAGRITFQSGTGLSGSAAYSYGDASRPSERKTHETLPLAFGGTVDSGFTYTPEGRLSEVTGTGAGRFEYDESGNVTTATISGTTMVYHYDPATNRLLDRTAGGSVETTYTFDVLGRRTAQRALSNPNAATFTYDGASRLTRFFVSPSLCATYTYDATGQRMSSVVTKGGLTTATTYSYGGLTLLSLSSTAMQGSTETTWSIAYLYTSDGRPYAGIYRSGSFSVPFSILTTDRGDIAELIDSNGTPFAAYRYDVWGRPLLTISQETSLIGATAAAVIMNANVLRYASYAYDAESGLYYCSARYYDPETMQFLMKDIAKTDGEESAYQYCGGDPVGKVDPSGHIWRSPQALLSDWEWRSPLDMGQSSKSTIASEMTRWFRSGVQIRLGLSLETSGRYDYLAKISTTIVYSTSYRDRNGNKVYWWFPVSPTIDYTLYVRYLKSNGKTYDGAERKIVSLRLPKVGRDHVPFKTDLYPGSMPVLLANRTSVKMGYVRLAARTPVDNVNLYAGPKTP